jgi:hypothetical protein
MSQDDTEQGLNQKKDDPTSKTKPFKSYQQGPPVLKLISPATLPWGVLFLIFYLLFATITGSWHEGLVSEVIGSIRVLILTIGLFLSFLGIFGLILSPKDAKKAIPDFRLIYEKLRRIK